MIQSVDPLARRIGAVNTIVVDKDGALKGFNNDGNGFIQSLRDAKPTWQPDSGPIVVLGAAALDEPVRVGGPLGTARPRRSIALRCSAT